MHASLLRAMLGVSLLGLSPSRALADDLLRTFDAERSQLAREFKALREQYRSATPREWHAVRQKWEEENRERLTSLRQHASDLAERRVAEIPLVDEIELPENPSPLLEEFLLERANLRNSLVTLRTQLREASRESTSAAIEAWRAQHQSRLEAQNVRARVLGSRSPRDPEKMPQLAVPTSAAPLLRTFLVERHAFARETLEKETLFRELPAAQQAHARHEWHQQNAERLARLQRLAHDLSTQPQQHPQ